MNIDTLVEDIYTVIKGEGGWDGLSSSDFGHAIGKAAHRRFAEPPQRNNTLRMSNIGKPCARQLWYDVNEDHEDKDEMQPWVLFKFFYGDMIEEAVLELAKAAGHKVEGQQDEVELDGILGHYDAIIDGMLVDVKSCSTYAFKKFKQNGVRDDDPFGYISQLSSYLYCLQDDPRVTNKTEAGFLAIDKQNGHIHLDIYDMTPELKTKEQDIKERKDIVARSQPPQRTYEDVDDGKSGNKKLPTACSYCGWKEKCWPNLRTFVYANGPRYLTRVVKEPNVPEAW